jgi:hypothetical protein
MMRNPCPVTSQGPSSSAADEGHAWIVGLVAVILTLLFVEVFYLLVVHGEPEYSAQGRGATQPAQPDTSGTPSQTPTATDAPVASEVGQTRTGENADTTLLQTRRIHPPADRRPGPRKEWFGIRARTCVHADARPSGGLPWSSWAVIDTRGQRYLGSAPPWDDYPDQQLPTTGIRAGQCHVGWVLVAIPRGAFAQVEQVVFRPRGPRPAEWAV